jgi:hypothetical protein
VQRSRERVDEPPNPNVLRIKLRDQAQMIGCVSAAHLEGLETQLLSRSSWKRKACCHTHLQVIPYASIASIAHRLRRGTIQRMI